MQLLIRFLAGGLLVSLFALIADGVRPKGFAGLFGAAPSISLATLTLTVVDQGARYAALEARSMILGAVAFLLYALTCTYCLAVRHYRVLPTTMALLILWIGTALGLAQLLPRGSA